MIPGENQNDEFLAEEQEFRSLIENSDMPSWVADMYHGGVYDFFEQPGDAQSSTDGEQKLPF